jgi:hypothetical protein
LTDNYMAAEFPGGGSSPKVRKILEIDEKFHKHAG